MTDRAAFKYEFSADRSYSLDSEWIKLSERDFRSSLRRLREIVKPVQHTPQWADDLLQVARAIYLADKKSNRKLSSDRWTRKIQLSVQVSQSEIWTSDALETLHEILTNLTSDNWEITIRGGSGAIDDDPRLFGTYPAAEITLFSGGLDSGAYAALRSIVTGERLLLVSHDHGGADKPQHDLHSWIFRNIAQREVEWAPVRDEPRSNGASLETSTRSRGLLFAATGIFAAAAHGVSQLAIPENGQLALNSPLTHARSASLSTRSVHPFILERINRLTHSLGGEVTAHNPFLERTKGQVCHVALDAGLNANALARTVSCGNHSAHRMAGNCGYCYPCLIRRSGLIAAIGSDPTEYQKEFNELYTPETRRHLYDLQLWSRNSIASRDVIGDMPLPRSVSIKNMASVLERGRMEVAAMLAHFNL